MVDRFHRLPRMARLPDDQSNHRLLVLAIYGLHLPPRRTPDYAFGQLNLRKASLIRSLALKQVAGLASVPSCRETYRSSTDFQEEP